MDTSTQLNPKTVALMTIDTQNDFTLPGAPAEVPGTFAVVPKIAQLIQAFRHAAKPVIHVVRLYLPDGSNAELCRREAIRAGARIVQPGSEGAELVEALKPIRAVRLNAEPLLQGQAQQIGEQEFVVCKPRWGAFYHTPLEEFLRDRKIDSLVFCGCNFPNCPRASLYEASERDFRVALVTDAVSGLYDQGMRELERIGVMLQDTARTIAWLKSGGDATR